MLCFYGISILISASLYNLIIYIIISGKFFPTVGIYLILYQSVSRIVDRYKQISRNGVFDGDKRIFRVRLSGDDVIILGVVFFQIGFTCAYLNDIGVEFVGHGVALALQICKRAAADHHRRRHCCCDHRNHRLFFVTCHKLYLLSFHKI